jgi:hypothetical protein
VIEQLELRRRRLSSDDGGTDEVVVVAVTRETLSTLQLLGGAVALCGLALALSGVQVQRGEPAVLPEAGR